jgi:hypothetical protein
VNEIDPGIKDLLERARPARPAAGAGWEDALRRSRRGRGRLFGLPTRGAILLAAALVVALGAVAQAETGVFRFDGRDSARHRQADRERRLNLVDEAAYGSIIAGLPRGQVTGISVIGSTNAVRISRVFGGSARRYARRAGVVVMKGPFTIPTYLQGCQGTPAICPVPVGHWAWLAYEVLPMPRKGPMAGLVNARWIRVAPMGTPYPHVARLGHVIREHYFPTNFKYVAVRQHQGTLTIVVRKGARLTLSPLACVYSDNRYTAPVCGALARYVAYLGQPHPDESVPDTGDFTRVSGDLGGWRGNLVLTPQSLGQAPPALRAAVERGLASLHGRPIKTVPGGIDCVVNPLPCYRPIETTTHRVIEAINRHGYDLRRIQPSEIPARFTAHLPAGAHITGAATNAGEPAVARRGYTLSIEFDRNIRFSARVPYERQLGRKWGVFVDENLITFYHPFYRTLSLPKLAGLGPRKKLRVLRQFQATVRRNGKRNHYGYLLIRTLDQLTTTR